MTNFTNTAPGTVNAVQLLSASGFRGAVLSVKPAVAVFDCDGTLWSGDAGSAFMHWSVAAGLICREAVEWLNVRYQAYTHGEVSELAICGAMVQVYQGLPEHKMRLAAAEFFAAQVEPNIFPEMLHLVRELQQQEVDIWAVSSTNDWVIEEGMKRFGIAPDRVLAARVAIVGDHVTGQLLDVPTDDGKVEALRRAGITAPDVVFGNSVHDAAMLAIARQPFAVNPTPGLLERCAAESWPVYHPSSVRPN